MEAVELSDGTKGAIVNSFGDFLVDGDNRLVKSTYVVRLQNGELKVVSSSDIVSRRVVNYGIRENIEAETEWQNKYIDELFHGSKSEAPHELVGYETKADGGADVDSKAEYDKKYKSGYSNGVEQAKGMTPEELIAERERMEGILDESNAEARGYADALDAAIEAQRSEAEQELHTEDTVPLNNGGQEPATENQENHRDSPEKAGESERAENASDYKVGDGLRIVVGDGGKDSRKMNVSVIDVEGDVITLMSATEINDSSKKSEQVKGWYVTTVSKSELDGMFEGMVQSSNESAKSGDESVPKAAGMSDAELNRRIDYLEETELLNDELTDGQREELDSLRAERERRLSNSESAEDDSGAEVAAPPVSREQTEAGVESSERGDEAKENLQLDRERIGSEVDEHGVPFVKTEDGTTVFGEITENTGLPQAPIKLSEGVIDENGNGYGLLHIDYRHGKEIRDAGFKSVEEFVGYVAKNYDPDNIKVGKRRVNGRGTYIIQVEDGHANLLYIELSQDGTYWNVNSGGVFRKGYTKKKKNVEPNTEHPTSDSASSDKSFVQTDSIEGSKSADTHSNNQRLSEHKDNTLSTDKQEKGSESLAQPSDSEGGQTIPDVAEAENTESIPVDKQGNPIYTAVSASRAYADISEIYGDRAGEYIDKEFNDAQKKLAKHKNKRIPISKPAQFQKAKADYEKLSKQLEAEARQWAEIKREHANAQAVEAERNATQRKAEEAERLRRAEEQHRAEQAEKQRLSEVESGRVPYQVGSNIKQQYADAKKVYGSEDEITLAGGEVQSGRWVLGEAGTITPSHNPENGFKPSEGFPADENGNNSNDRAYDGDKAAQQKTYEMADDYDARALHNPVVVSEGAVLSGNNRTMSGDIAAKRGTDGKYVTYLQEHPEKYGFTPEDVAQFKHPRVWFELDKAPSKYDTKEMAKYNERDMKSQSKTEKAVKASNLVSDATLNYILDRLSDRDRMSDLYADTSAMSGIFKQLQNDGVIGANDLAELFDGETVSAEGRQLLENCLLGKAFEGSPETLRRLERYKTLRESVLDAVVQISKNKALGKEYALTPELTEAIRLCYDAKSADAEMYKEGAAVSSFALQGSMFNDNTGHEPYRLDAITVLLANMLNDKSSTKLKRVLSAYNASAAEAASGQLGLFDGGKKESKADVVQRAVDAIVDTLTPSQRREYESWHTKDSKSPQISEHKVEAVEDSESRRMTDEADMSEKKAVSYSDPRTMPENEKARRGDMLRDATAIDVAPRQIVATKELTARKAAEQWWDENVGGPILFDTEAGKVEIDRSSIKDSLSHGYRQEKLDAIASLPEGFRNAVYLGSLEDFTRPGVMNHYFAYPINYEGQRRYVFCRAMADNNKNRLYVHEVFLENGIKESDTLQTIASASNDGELHGGIALYKAILRNILDVSERKVTNSASDKQGLKSESSALEKELVEIAGRYVAAGNDDLPSFKRELSALLSNKSADELVDFNADMLRRVVSKAGLDKEQARALRKMIDGAVPKEILNEVWKLRNAQSAKKRPKELPSHDNLENKREAEDFDEEGYLRFSKGESASGNAEAYSTAKGLVETAGIEVVEVSDAEATAKLENKKTPVAGQPNRVNEKQTSGSVLMSAQGDSSSRTRVPSKASAKIANDTQSAKNNLKKFANDDFKISTTSLQTTFRDLSRLLNLQTKGGSRYTILQTDGGFTIAVRLSDHGANGNNFKQDNADNNLSIVIERRRFDDMPSEIEFTEATIPMSTFESRPEDVVKAIVRGVNDVLSDKPFTLDSSIGRVERKGGHRYLRDGKGVVYGWTEDGKIYLNRDAMNPETPIHEYTHLWDEMIQKENPELWARGKELMKQTSLWDEVMNDPNYADIRSDEDAVASEVHSRLTGKRGAERIEELMKEAAAEPDIVEKAKKYSLLHQLKRWLHDMFKGLKKTLTKWSKQELRNLTAEDFVNLTLRDLAEGLNPKSGDKNLVAVHNISADKLKEAMELGGFPMPSIAITKAGVGHSGFGEISLVFGEKSINPANRSNKVYSGDAWTPIFPSVGYKLNEAKTSEIYRRANNAGRLPFFNAVDFHPDNYERRIDSGQGSSLVKAFRDDYSAKQLYLSEQGKAVDKFEEHTVEKYSTDDIKLYEKVLREIGEERLRGESIESLYPELAQLIESCRGEVFRARNPKVAKVKTRNVISKALDYADNGNLKTEKDYGATMAKIDERVDQKEFETWLEEMFAGVVEKEGIRNERDMFTPSGNIRKWETLYDEVTLDNVVKAMQRQSPKGGTGIFNSSIFGSAAKELKDMEEVRQEAAARIRLADDEEIKAEKERVISRLGAISLPSVKGVSETMDFVGNVQEAVSKSHTAKDIYGYLRNIYPDMTMEVAKEIAEVVGDIQKMSTRYLEAKPQRAVGFEEVKFAVVPEGTPKEVIEQLESYGIAVRTYERGNEQQRSSIISQETSERDLRFHAAMTRSREDFDALREQAIAERGHVMPGLNEAEVRVVDVPRHDFKGDKPIAEAKTWAKQNIAGEHTLTDSDGQEMAYSISRRAIDKYLSSSAIDKSYNLGVHLSVLTKLPEVISESIEAEVHPDYKKGADGVRHPKNGYNEDKLIHRYYGAVDIEGETFRVKTTIIETQGNKVAVTPHSFEVTEVELLSNDNSPKNLEPTVSPEKPGAPHRTAKLLQGVEKSYDSGKKLLAESAQIDMEPGREHGSVPESDIRFRYGDADETEMDNLLHGIEAARMLANGADEVPDAMHRADLAEYGGDTGITFVYGNVGNPNKNYKGGYGIAHIGAKHGADTILRVVDAIASGNIARYVQGNKTVVIEKDGYEALLALTRYGNKTTWLFNGWDKIETTGENGKVSANTVSTQANPTFSREDLGAAVSDAKVTKILGIKIENEEKIIAAQTSPEAKLRQAERMSEKFNTPIRIVTDVKELTNPDAALQESMRRNKGFFDPATGEVVVVMPNNKSVEDVAETVFHEVVAHKGLRELIGEESYDAFCDEIYSHLKDDLKPLVSTKKS